MEIQRNELIGVSLGSLENGDVFEFEGALYIKTYPQNGKLTYVVDLSDGEQRSDIKLNTMVKPFLCKLVEIER